MTLLTERFGADLCTCVFSFFILYFARQVAIDYDPSNCRCFGQIEFPLLKAAGFRRFGGRFSA
jgi:hypothetical protein